MTKFTSHFVESRLFVKILSLISSLALTSSYCCSTYFVILTLFLKHEVQEWIYFTESSFSHSSQEPHSSTIFIEKKKKKEKMQNTQKQNLKIIATYQYYTLYFLGSYLGFLNPWNSSMFNCANQVEHRWFPVSLYSKSKNCIKMLLTLMAGMTSLKFFNISFSDIINYWDILQLYH